MKRRIGIIQEAYALPDGKIDFVKMASHGYETLDYQLFCDIHGENYTLAPKALEEKMTSLRRDAATCGIEIYQTHGPWRYPPRDDTEENRKEWFAAMEHALEASAMLGARFMAVHPLMPFGAGYDPEPETLWNMNLEFYTRLLPKAHATGVTLCYENMPMKALSNSKPDAILRAVKEINDPYFKICLDTGHVSCYGEQPGQALRALAPEIRMLHVHSNDGQNDLHWLPLPNCGIVDWADFRQALKKLDASVPLSLETAVSRTLPERLYETMQKATADYARWIANAEE